MKTKRLYPDGLIDYSLGNHKLFWSEEKQAMVMYKIRKELGE